MTLFEGNLQQIDRQRERERRERERERVRERAREREREREGTTGSISINFPHRFCPFCECAQQTVFAWFTPSLMDCRVWSLVIAFGGLYRFTVFRAHF